MKEIAVLGYAARLPGAETVEDVWTVLVDGEPTIGAIPQERWSNARFQGAQDPEPGHSYTQSAGVLEEPFAFDADYFRISRREAEQMDPQQRILLETTARAFDHAGIDPNTLESTRTGVFVGASAADHSTTITQSPDLIGPHFMLGNTLSILSNRLSYTWDFKGPSMTVDTACSSSLVALDLARAALERGEIDTAVVAGVNLLLSPYSFIGFSQARMISPSGTCTPFTAQADGYVRSEGAVAFILQNRAIAELSKLNVRSFLVGTAVNSDGRTNGLALPSSERQSELMDSVMDTYDINSEDVAFVEAHGTGTPIGDPREAAAIGKAYGKGRKTPLPIGSAKAQFGHLEPAAGLVGLLKAQLCLERGYLPATRAGQDLSPDIDFDALNLALPTSAQTLPAREGGWSAAVNSFGFGGTNAHAILRQASPKKPQTTAFPPSLLLTAASAGALSRLVDTWAELIETKEPQTLADMAISANRRIARHAYRVCLKAGSVKILRDEIAKWQKNGTKPQRAAGPDLPVAFVFSGNGTAWAGMARDVFAGNSAFKRKFKEAAAAFADLGQRDLESKLFDPELETMLDRAEIVQPLIFSIQVAMASALENAGIRPTATLGHSVGECAAAVVAKRVSLAEAARIIISRSRAFEPLRDTGEMAALNCSREDAEKLISALGLGLDISAENAPRNVTVSGSPDAIKQLLQRAKAQRISGLRLAIAYPYHSRAVDQIDAALAEDLGTVEHSFSDTRFYSGWMGSGADDQPLDASYWRRNAREMVAFKSAVEAMDSDGLGLFLEISPRPVLLGNLKDTLSGSGRAHAVLDTLKKGAGAETMPEAIARRVFAAGGRADDLTILGPQTYHAEPVPDYPFDREFLKIQPQSGFAALATDTPEHPLLGRALSTDGFTWTSSASLVRLPWLADHKVGGAILLPAMAMLDMFRAAAAQIAPDVAFELRDVEFLKPVVLNEGTPRLHMSFDEDTSRLTLRAHIDGPSERVARATLRTGVALFKKDCSIAANQSAKQLYQGLGAAGLEYGPAFARVTDFGLKTRGIDVALSELADPSPTAAFVCRVDALLHGAALLADAPATRVPYRIDRARFHTGAPVVGGRLIPSDSGLEGGIDVSATDASGVVVAQLDGLAFARLPSNARPARMIHDESRVTISGGTPVVGGILNAMMQNVSEEPSDLDVARAALAGRLAWDICFGAEAGDDPRGKIAADWLQEIEIADNKGNGLVARDACPWPSLESLLQLLSEGLGHASDELAAGLIGATGGPAARRKPLARVRDVAANVIEGLNGPPLRLLLSGDIDARLIATAHALGHHVTITASDLDLALARLGDTSGLEFSARPLNLVTDAEPFDIVIGLSILGSDETTLQSLSDCARQATEFLLIGERPDMFALLTHGHESRARAYSALRRFGTSTAFEVPGDEAIMIHHSERAQAPIDATGWSARVIGSGPFADTLASSLPEAAQATRLVVLDEKAAPEDRFAVMQSTAALLKDTETAWIICLNLDQVGELSSLRRVLCNETGNDLRLAVISQDTARETVIAALQATEEREIVLANGQAEALRILPETTLPPTLPMARRRLVPSDRVAHQAAPVWVTEQRIPPGEGEIEIAVEATGLNFRDVMLAQGMLPDDAFLGGYAGRNLGIECAGVVTRAGAKTNLKEGDRVASFAAGAFASHTTVPEACALPLPDALSAEEGATLPVAFLTADYALRDCARLEPGESVLIHGAAGGVGLAALQIASAMNLRIFATAGSPEKRRLLKALDVEACFDSRSLDFADQVMQATDGRGVDAVVNSLAGAFQTASLDCLASFGRFIELGKRDIFENSSFDQRVMRNNISFFAIDADQLVKDRPKRALAILKRISAALKSGDVLPLPHRVMAQGTMSDAIDTMQRADHIGKIVVKAPPPPEPDPARDVDYRGGWLITGGTRGFGLATAQWLARRGANRLWLASRSGTLSEDERRSFQELGVGVEAIALDVSNKSDVQTLVERIQDSEEPLTGVVHSAMVLDDAHAADLSSERFRRVWEPKVTGARVLDQATRALKPAHFWLYSSIACRFGNPGQAAYVAANGALEDIARARKSQGLPALAIAWSAISDVGFLTASDDLRERIAANGVDPIRSDDALDALDAAICAEPGRATITIGTVDWSKLAQSLQVRSDPLFEFLRLRSFAVDGTDLDTLIAEKGAEAATITVTTLMLKEFAQILRVSEANLDPTLTLGDIGFDSLLGMHLRLTIEERLNTQLPANILSERLTIQRLAQVLVEARAAPLEADHSMAKALAETHLVDTGVANEVRDEIVRSAVGRGRT